MIGRFLSIALIALATLAVAAGNDISDAPLWLALLSWCVFLAIAINAIALLQRSKLTLWPLLAAAAGVYAVGCVALALFQLGSPLGLDADFALASPSDSLKTLVRMIGWPAAVLSAVAVAGIVAAFAASLKVFAAPLATSPRRRRASAVTLIALVAGVAFIGLPHPYLRTPVSARGGIDIRPAVPPSLNPAITRNESVFLVQLESVNALIASDAYVLKGRAVPSDPLTSMRYLAKKGIFFPHFWGPTVLTHRAQETILCGAVRNVHAPFFDQLIPWDGRCLPAMLREAGYKTVFLSSFPDQAFGMTGRFMKRAGFDDIHFADFMKPGDPLTRWGYDEHAFFTRAFEYLRTRYEPDEKLFVYFAVCAHHYGFTRYAKTDANFLLGDEDRRIALYLSSQKVQDESLLTFDRLSRDFAGGNAHVLYVPDHSIPLGLYGARAPSLGASIDNFVTTFLYVPPESRAAEFALGRTVDEVYAQTDLIPTIAELLSDRPQANSLVPFLRRDAPARYDYERCHVMTQPYAGKHLLVARGDAAYEYHVAMQTLREFRIRHRPMRQELVRETEGVSYEEFERRYGCRRYGSL